jgi:micrococcal nuclease
LNLFLLAAFATLPAISSLPVAPLQEMPTTLEVQSVTRIHDGDTFTVDLADCSVSIVCRDIPIRVRGIDAPEIHGKCSSEKQQAQEARTQLKRLVNGARRVVLVNPRRDKYFRLDADIKVDGKDVGEAMTATGLVRAYHGEKRKGWCGR